ncbi:hypothetical protein LINGRAHAP2_LOCUS6330 [Linum grandiflorum]
MTIGEFGTDILLEILIRIPNPRSVCQCKLVCKRWGSLISSPLFNRRFVSHHQTMKHPHMPVDPYKLKSFILSFLPPMPSTVRNALRVLDCNNDLVLCGFWDVECDDGVRGRSYLVCNPFTKQWVALPLAPRKYVGYLSPAARLVCEPRNSNKLDLGDDQSFPLSEYRFRVVCVYQVAQPRVGITLDLFCSESGQWTKEALFRHLHVKKGLKGVVSCNGKLFWKYITEQYITNLVAVFNPFRLDIPSTSIDVYAFRGYPHWFISASQGVLHVIAIENLTVPVRVSIWRLEEDGKSWRKLHAGWVNETSKCCNYQVEGCYRPLLHPHKPEIVFFNPFRSEERNVILCCNLRTEELEFFANVEGRPDVCLLQVFQPRISFWATHIPRYDELGGMHDGSYSSWIQSSSEAKTHSLNICKDEVMKSAAYKSYIECVTEEANWDIAAEMIQNKMREIVLRERMHPFPFDKDLDGTVLKDIEAEVDAIAEWKEKLKQRLWMGNMSAELPYPPMRRYSLLLPNTAEIIPSRKRKISRMIFWQRKQPRFPDDKKADMKDVESYMASIGNPKQVKQAYRGCFSEISPEVPHPLVPVEGERKREKKREEERKRRVREELMGSFDPDWDKLRLARLKETTDV